MRRKWIFCSNFLSWWISICPVLTFEKWQCGACYYLTLLSTCQARSVGFAWKRRNNIPEFVSLENFLIPCQDFDFKLCLQMEITGWTAAEKSDRTGNWFCFLLGEKPWLQSVWSGQRVSAASVMSCLGSLLLELVLISKTFPEFLQALDHPQHHV